MANLSSAVISRRRLIQNGLAGLACVSTGMASAQSVDTELVAPERGIPAAKSLVGRVFKAVKGVGSPRAEDVQEVFARFREMGFDGVESGQPALRDAYQTATEATGFQIHGVVNGGQWQTRLSHPDEATRLRGQQNLEGAIRRAHVLGGSSVLLVPGAVRGDDETHDHVWHRSIELVAPLLPVASRLGVRILIETVWNGFCETPDLLCKYIDAFHSPWVGAYLDLGNVQTFAPTEEWVRCLDHRIVKLDVKDWGKETKFTRLGEGDVNWPAVRQALLDIGFTGWATREGRDRDLQDTSDLMDRLLLGIEA